MVKSPTHESIGSMHFSESYRKLKRLRLFEPSLGVLGFFVVTVLVTSCFFYFNCRNSVENGFLDEGKTEKIVMLKYNVSTEVKNPLAKINELKIVDFMGESGGKCDVFDGDWVWDKKYPLYQSKDCRFMDEGFRCSENGRPDVFYTKWRWQPKQCNLPRFDAMLMLEKIRNKRIVFAGDSIGRNQWESLLCMLSSVVTNKSSIYEVNGNPITKHKGALVFKFDDFNCTIEYYRSPFLVLHGRPPSRAPKKIKTTLRLDKMDWNSVKWKGADILVLNTGHWWNYEKTIRGGCYFQERSRVQLKMKVERAYQRSLETVVSWIHNEVNPSKTQVFFRTFAPVHFRGGDWRNGGSCHLETLPEMGSSLATPQPYKIAMNVLLAHMNRSEAVKFQLLNITHMTLRRKDAHLSLYYLGPGVGLAPLHRQDCSHWCLPGVPDSWNELLYALFLKNEAHKSNSTIV